MNPEEGELEQVKGIVNSTNYKKMEVANGKIFFHGKDLSNEEQIEYRTLLKEFLDVFAWTPLDLKGIPPELGQYHIDLMDGFVPIKQRQYRLNPKYSLMVKEEIDRLLEAGLIYSVNNLEWV